MKKYLVNYRKNNRKTTSSDIVTASSVKEAREVTKRKHSMNGYHRIVVKSVTDIAEMLEK